jgi:hypothetical protein
MRHGTFTNFGRIAARTLCAASALLFAATQAMAADGACGKLVELATHDDSKMPFVLAGDAGTAKAVLVMLPGGGGHLALDDKGCPTQLRGNSLVRTQGLFHKAGFLTALVDAPTDYRERDGLEGFRIDSDHAEDIGKVIADLRTRTRLPVWLIGTSRGTISAANAAARLKGAAAPDGLVLTSPVTSGFEGGRKAWVAQTVFSVDLSDIRLPVLVVAHDADMCIRTPPALAPQIVEKTEGVREQVAIVKGGPCWAGGESVEACAGRAPHGFVDQEAEVTDGIVRFIRGGSY